jgi:hypothetical protein
MPARGDAPTLDGMSNAVQPKTTTAFYAQAAISFGVSEVLSRVDQARLDKLLAEHDPFKVAGH